MQKLIIAAGLMLAMSTASADGVENKWRVEFSGNAESAGRIVLQVAPAKGEPIRAVAEVVNGRAENDVARDVGAALQAVASDHYNVEVDDGEDVLLKKQGGEGDFVVTVVENTVQGVRIDIDAE
ncbi:hypothetical protein [Thermomonas carbonis]|uniref:PepSY domain-containing protein n=1 Tax=Thermomonas carbonis TaxID=1463158 RepID=A0A7G9STV2_9GAMM|nr:hypothetical protein [Thermomonas carbonis]QNN71277.1 hypothetical protein H9L16_06915 [Thermomonas carbonis]GHC10702.1 hypothetical protein GCM10010080_27880 [Thermomonas carbonis]